jgi:small-conductance mechanosensitive channel
MSLSEWPWWAPRLAWTVFTLAASYAIGYLITAYVSTRLGRFADRTRVTWDDIVLAQLRRRIPFWSLLVGVWLSLERWPLQPQTHLLITRVATALVWASVTLAVASIATRLVSAYAAAAKPSVPVSGLTLNVVRIVITTLGALVMIRALGQDITPMLTALGVGGLAVALALQEPLSNLFAGLFVSLAGHLRIGDYVRLDSGAEGHIVDFTWRETRLQTLGGAIVVVPNAQLSKASVSNFSRPSGQYAVTVDAAVHYAADLTVVERVALEVARDVIATVPGAVPEAEPSVRFHTFADPAIRFSINLRARAYPDQYLLRHECLRRLHARLRAEGVPFPVVLPPTPAPPRSS